MRLTQMYVIAGKLKVHIVDGLGIHLSPWDASVVEKVPLTAQTVTNVQQDSENGSLFASHRKL